MTKKEYIKYGGFGLPVVLVVVFTVYAIQENLAEWGDVVVFILLLFVLIFVGFWYAISKDHIDLKLRQLAKTGVIAVAALALRFPVLCVPEHIRGDIAESLLLAVAAGAVASFVILWIDRQKSQASVPEMLGNSVTWTFRKLCNNGNSVEMQYVRIYQKTNSSEKGIYGWEIEWFELCPGTEGVRSPCVQVASSRNDLLPGAQGERTELPLDLDGFVIRLKDSDQEARKAWLEPGQAKWFRVEATLTVPVSYWDYSVGLTGAIPGERPQFTMEDETETLALILASADNRLAFNFDDGGKRTENSISLEGEPQGRLRAQAFWYPAKELTKNAKALVERRFKP